MNIDRIARQMVDVEPSADLEARIRARLDTVVPERTGAAWFWRMAVPAAAVVIVTLAIVLPGRTSKVQPESVGGTIAAASSPVANVDASQLRPTLEPGPAAQQRPASRRANLTDSRLSQASSQLSAEELAWMDRRMPALEPVIALQLERITVDSIQPEPLAITPLTMTPVSTEGAGIERRNDR